MTQLNAQFAVDYGDFRLDARLQVPAQGVTVIFGPSGCGKTTFLRCLAGLERSPTGFLQIGDAVWQDESRSLFLPVHQRPLGMVFQEGRLFPHMSVRANCEYGLKRIPPEQRKISLEQTVDILGLAPLLDRRPGNLSGGEQQRVALGRALLTSPRLLLLDEPLANLDQERKQEILPFLSRLRMELDIPMIYVSHSLAEVLQLVDTLVLLRRGEIVDSGPANEILSNLKGTDSLASIGKGAVLETRVVDHDPTFALTRVRLGDHDLFVPMQELVLGEKLRLHLLAQDVSIHLGPPQSPTSVLNILPAQILEVGASDPRRSSVDIRLDVGEPILATITRKSLDHLKLQPGQSVYAHIKAVKMVHQLEGY